MAGPNVSFVYELRSARTRTLIERLRKTPLLPDERPLLPPEDERQYTESLLEKILPGIFRFLDLKIDYFTRLKAKSENGGAKETVFPPVEVLETEPLTFLAMPFVPYLLKFDRLCCLLDECRLTRVIEIDEYHIQMRSLEGSTFNAANRVRRAVAKTLAAEAAEFEEPDQSSH